MHENSFSPANYLATLLVEEFGYIHAKQQHIDLLERKINDMARQQHISLEKIPDEAQIKDIFSRVQTYIDLDEIFAA